MFQMQQQPANETSGLTSTAMSAGGDALDGKLVFDMARNVSSLKVLYYLEVVSNVFLGS